MVSQGYGTDRTEWSWESSGNVCEKRREDAGD